MPLETKSFIFIDLTKSRRTVSPTCQTFHRRGETVLLDSSQGPPEGARMPAPPYRTPPPSLLAACRPPQAAPLVAHPGPPWSPGRLTPEPAQPPAPGTDSPPDGHRYRFVDRPGPPPVARDNRLGDPDLKRAPSASTPTLPCLAVRPWLTLARAPLADLSLVHVQGAANPAGVPGMGSAQREGPDVSGGFRRDPA
jgi:hypothetical protein